MEILSGKVEYFNCEYWEKGGETGNCFYLLRFDLGTGVDKNVLRPLNIPPNLAVGDGEVKKCIAPLNPFLKCNRRLRRD